MMKPPSGGPITGHQRRNGEPGEGRDQLRLGTVRKMTKPAHRPMAPPMPCTMRNSTKSNSDEAKPQASRASGKTMIAALNTVRAPKRSAAQPLNGMNTANDSR